MGQSHEPRSLRPRLILDLAAIHFCLVVARAGQRASYVAPAGITDAADLARWVEAGAASCILAAEEATLTRVVNAARGGVIH